MALRVIALPRPGETVSAHGASIDLGGKGANQAVAAARVGAAVTFIGATGRDEAAGWMRERLADDGVDVTHLASLDGAPSGRAVVMVSDEGDNSIVVVGGANLMVAPSHLPEEAIAGHRVYLSQLESPTEVIAALFSHPAATAGIRLLNAAPAIPDGRRLFPLVDVLIVNEVELAAYAEISERPEDPTDIVHAAWSLIARADQAVVVTLGAAGLAIVREDGVTRIPGRRVEVVDTTGAGDCFCGVLAAELANGATLEAAARFANDASALAVTRLGASSSAPTRLAIEALLREQD